MPMKQPRVVGVVVLERLVANCAAYRRAQSRWCSRMAGECGDAIVREPVTSFGETMGGTHPKHFAGETLRSDGLAAARLTAFFQTTATSQTTEARRTACGKGSSHDERQLGAARGRTPRRAASMARWLHIHGGGHRAGRSRRSRRAPGDAVRKRYGYSSGAVAHVVRLTPLCAAS